MSNSFVEVSDEWFAKIDTVVPGDEHWDGNNLPSDYDGLALFFQFV